VGAKITFLPLTRTILGRFSKFFFSAESLSQLLLSQKVGAQLHTLRTHFHRPCVSYIYNIYFQPYSMKIFLFLEMKFWFPEKFLKIFPTKWFRNFPFVSFWIPNFDDSNLTHVFFLLQTIQNKLKWCIVPFPSLSLKDGTLNDEIITFFDFYGNINDTDQKVNPTSLKFFQPLKRESSLSILFEICF